MRTSLYIKHSSGAMHALEGRRLQKLQKEILAGRGGAEVTALVSNGYEGFLARSGEVHDFEDLVAEFTAQNQGDTVSECRACSGDGFVAADGHTRTHERVTRDSKRCDYCGGTGERLQPDAICTCGHTLAQHVNGSAVEGCLAGMTNLMRRNGLCSCERFAEKETS